jgi:hypothetical protein
MPLGLDETTFELHLNLEKIPELLQESALEDAGQFVIESILDYVGQGKSPVAGQGAFRKLSAEYAEREKGGDTLANLDLSGSMLDALEYRVIGDKIVIGIFDGDLAKRSYNHNVGDTLPKRQFIPDDGNGDYLKAEIIRGIGSILSEYFDENL